MPQKTMRAIAKLKPGPGLQLTEVPVPVPGINDVLIKVKKTRLRNRIDDPNSVDASMTVAAYSLGPT